MYLWENSGGSLNFLRQCYKIFISIFIYIIPKANMRFLNQKQAISLNPSPPSDAKK